MKFILNDPPYPLPDTCYNYGNLDEECSRMIQSKSPEEQTDVTSMST